MDYVFEGNKLYEKDQIAEAAEMYSQAIKNGQNLPFAWFNLGNCRARKAEFPAAIVAYNRSVELAPQFSRPWILLGDVYTTLGDAALAVVSYKRALELEPANSYAWKWLGENALRSGDFTEAMRTFEASLKYDPNQPEVYMALSEAYAGIRDFDGALDILRQAILYSPGVDAALYYYRGHLYERAEKIDKAVRAYEEGLLYDSKNTTMYLRLARMRRDRDEDFLALLILETAVDKCKPSTELFLERANIYFKQGRLEKALEDYTSALKLGSAFGRMGVENVSAAYWNRGDKEKAAEIREFLQGI